MFELILDKVDMIRDKMWWSGAYIHCFDDIHYNQNMKLKSVISENDFIFYINIVNLRINGVKKNE